MTPAAVLVAYAWRGSLASDEVEQLHAEAFVHPPGTRDWRAQFDRHSLGWVTARDEAGRLVGFVNLAWDGGIHAFLLDTIVARDLRRCGIATHLIAIATDEARAAGCDWLHVDFKPALANFYLGATGFRATDAGIIALR